MSRAVRGLDRGRHHVVLPYLSEDAVPGPLGAHGPHRSQQAATGAQPDALLPGHLPLGALGQYSESSGVIFRVCEAQLACCTSLGHPSSLESLLISVLARVFAQGCLVACFPSAVALAMQMKCLTLYHF